MRVYLSSRNAQSSQRHKLTCQICDACHACKLRSKGKKLWGIARSRFRLHEALNYTLSPASRKAAALCSPAASSTETPAGSGDIKDHARAENVRRGSPKP